MDLGSAAALTFTLALVGIVIIAAALISGLIERTGFPQVAVFLGVGTVLGPTGLALLDVQLDSPVLRVVATLSLALVLFTDAVALDMAEVRRHTRLAVLLLGPGTLFMTVVAAVAAWTLLGLSLSLALILGASLASTDPVLLRGLLRRPDVPATARQALRLESGLNDVVLLPIVLVAMAFAGGAGSAGVNWPRLALDLFLLGPGAGVLVGLVAVATLALVRKRLGIRRDYESLYSLGVAFTAFAAAESVHGSGFLAAFAAGLTIAALDVELCDCFLEYGETTAELALLFTFVLFGASLIWSGLLILDPATLAFTLIVLFGRPLVYSVALRSTDLDAHAKFLVVWFGPRGLSSLLLVLLAVFAGVPGSERLFTVCCLVVLCSVVVHGGSLMLLGRRNAPPAVRIPDLPAARELVPAPAPAGPAATGPTPSLPAGTGASAAVAGSPDGAGAAVDGRALPERISLRELEALRRAGEPVIVVDARTQRAYEADSYQAAGAVRLHPEDAVRTARALDLPRDATLALYCA